MRLPSKRHFENMKAEGFFPEIRLRPLRVIFYHFSRTSDAVQQAVYGGDNLFTRFQILRLVGWVLDIWRD